MVDTNFDKVLYPNNSFVGGAVESFASGVNRRFGPFSSIVKKYTAESWNKLLAVCGWKLGSLYKLVSNVPSLPSPKNSIKLVLSNWPVVVT